MQVLSLQNRTRARVSAPYCFSNPAYLRPISHSNKNQAATRTATRNTIFPIFRSKLPSSSPLSSGPDGVCLSSCTNSPSHVKDSSGFTPLMSRPKDKCPDHPGMPSSSQRPDPCFLHFNILRCAERGYASVCCSNHDLVRELLAQVPGGEDARHTRLALLIR